MTLALLHWIFTSWVNKSSCSSQQKSVSAYYYINLYKADNSCFSPIIRYCTNWITKKDFFVIVFFWLPAFWLNLRHVKKHTFNTPRGAAFLLWPSEHRLKALGEVLGHPEDTHAWCPSSGQLYNIAALFSSCRQLHAVKLSSWPGVSTRLYKSMHHEDRETQPKFGKKTDMWICGEGWLGRRTDGKHEDEGRRKEALHTGKKWIFIMERKGHMLKLSPASIHHHAGTVGKKKQEIPGEAVLVPLLSPDFVD